MTVKDCALENGVDGIVAECGGAAMCGTCHVYLDPRDAERVTEIGPIEDEILDTVAAGRKPLSRLSCQIVMSDELDGLVVHLPAFQT